MVYAWQYKYVYMDKENVKLKTQVDILTFLKEILDIMSRAEWLNSEIDKQKHIMLRQFYEKIKRKGLPSLLESQNNEDWIYRVVYSRMAISLYVAVINKKNKEQICNRYCMLRCFSKMVSIQEYAKKHKKSVDIVRKYIRQGKLIYAKRYNSWKIPVISRPIIDWDLEDGYFKVNTDLEKSFQTSAGKEIFIPAPSKVRLQSVIKNEENQALFGENRKIFNLIINFYDKNNNVVINDYFLNVDDKHRFVYYLLSNNVDFLLNRELKLREWLSY